MPAVRYEYNGEEVVFYHGTRGRIDAFEPLSYFTSSEKAAKRYGKNLYKAYLHLRNPLLLAGNPGTTDYYLFIDITEAKMREYKQFGYDSVIYEGKLEDTDPEEMVSAVIFQTKQVEEIKYEWTTALDGGTDTTFNSGGLLASNGKPSNLTPEQYRLVRTPAFKAWFGDWEKYRGGKRVSQVIDENGEPLVVWHGSGEIFNEFDKAKLGKHQGRSPQNMFGFYFTNKFEVAKSFSDHARKNEWDEGHYKPSEMYVRPYFLNIRNAKHKDCNNLGYESVKSEINNLVDEIAINKSIDGFILTRYFDSMHADTISSNQYVPRNPSQIKLADGTNTTFDGSSPDIRFEDVGQLPSVCNKLYKDHHEVWAQMDKIEKNLTDSNAHEYAKEIYELCDTELLPHFTEEEKDLFPSVLNHKTQKDIDELIAQHKALLLLVATIKQYHRQSDILLFCKQIKEHIRKEESLMSVVTPDPYKKAPDNKLPGAIARIRGRSQKKAGGYIDNGEDKTLLSLFDYSGGWSEPFREAGWNVIQWDIKLSEFMDVNLLEDAETVLEMFENVDGIIAAPPCTDFTSSGAQFWKFKDEDGRTHKSVEMVNQVMRLVNLFAPTDPEYEGVWFWAIENPVGRMDKLVEINRKPWYFDPYEFAGWLNLSKKELSHLAELRAKDGIGLTRTDAHFVQETNAYTKKTGLWGDFAIPEKKPIEPVFAKQGSTRTSPMAALTGGKGAKTKELRSNTPVGFARAFYEANKNYQAQFQPGYWVALGWSEKEERKILADHNRAEPGTQKKLFADGGLLSYSELPEEAKKDVDRFLNSDMAIDYFNNCEVGPEDLRWKLTDVPIDKAMQYIGAYDQSPGFMNRVDALARKIRESKVFHPPIITAGHLEGNHRIMASWRLREFMFQNGTVPIYLMQDTEELAKGGSITPNYETTIHNEPFKKWFGDWELAYNLQQNDPGIDTVTIANMNKVVSKVVDATGKPLVVYHFNTEGNNDFTEFKPRQFGSYGENSMFYFATDKNWVNKFAQKFAYDSTLPVKVKPRAFFLDIKNPLDLTGVKLTPSEWLYYMKGMNLLTDNIESKLRETPESKYFRTELFSWQIFRYDFGHFRKKLIEGGYDGIKITDSNYGSKGSNISYVALYPNQIKLADGTNTTFDANTPDIRLKTGGEVGLSAFEKWFAGSKVVDRHGAPLVVYHGTQAHDFSIFQLMENPANESYGSEVTDNQLGFFFTDKKLMAEQFAGISYFHPDKQKYVKDKNVVKSARVIPCYLSIKNPYIIDENHDDFSRDYEYDAFQIYFNQIKEYGSAEKYRKSLIDAGFDGIALYHNTTGYYAEGEEYAIFVAFAPEQIKLADGSNTTFDANNADIRFGDGGQLDPLLETDNEFLYTKLYHASRIKPFKIEQPGKSFLATEGNGIYASVDQQKHASAFGGANQVELIIKRPAKLIIADRQYFNDAFLNGDSESLEILQQPISNTDSTWLQINKQAIAETGYLNKGKESTEDDLANLNAVLTRILIENGYDAVFVHPTSDIEGGDFYVILDTSLVVNHPAIQLKAGGGLNLLAPNGKPSNLTPEQYRVVRTPAFKAWFGDWEYRPETASKVVDENGEPLVVYHGTTQKFSVFDKNKIGSTFGVDSKGFFFTDELKEAEYVAEYKADTQGGERILKCFLNSKNPLTFNTNGIASVYFDERNYELMQNAEEKKSDGIIGYGKTGGVFYSVFEPSQIKLADGTNKTFDGSNPDIRLAQGGAIPERYRNMGFEKIGEKKQSTAPEKKWMVLAKKGDLYKIVHGGQKGMQDFSQHHNEERRKKFWQRMGGEDSPKAKDPFSPLYWHKKFKTWEHGGVLDDHTIKVAWPDSENTEVLESRMFTDLDKAKKFAEEKTGSNYFIMELTSQHKDNYRWKLLPYGMHLKYKAAVFLNKFMSPFFSDGGIMQSNDSLLAPNGKPTNLTPEQYRLVRTAAFKAWFGDWEHSPATASKMIDDNGEPLVCYHGTPNSFNVFRKDVGHMHDAGFYGSGFYFTFNKEKKWMRLARGEASYYGNGVMDCFLKTIKPFDISSLSVYKGKQINAIGAEALAFLYNIAIKFPDIADTIFLDKKTYNSEENEYDITKVPISVLPGLIKKYAELLKTFDSKGQQDEPTKWGYVKSEIVSYVDKDGETHSWESTDNLGPYYFKIDSATGNQHPTDVELELYFVEEALERYEGIEASYYPEGYMTRNPQITEAIMKNHDAILQSEYGDEVAVFESTQIKLADGSNTTFDASNPDIRFESGGEINELSESSKWFIKVMSARKLARMILYKSNPKFKEQMAGIQDAIDKGYLYVKTYQRNEDSVFVRPTSKLISLYFPEKTSVGFSDGGKIKYDRSGNLIGEGGWNVEHSVFDFNDYPQVTSSISKSETTESVYVTYTNRNTNQSVTLRFSNHENNAVKFGDQLNGDTATKAEVLYHLGLAKRTFIPKTYLWIDKQAIAKKNISKYEVCDKTIQEMYAMGEDADIAEYKGKLAKDSNYLILGDKVEKHEEQTKDILGQTVTRGRYIYDIDDVLAKGGTAGGKTITVKVPISSSLAWNAGMEALGDLSKLSEEDFIKTWKYVMATNYMWRSNIDVSDYVHTRHHHILHQAGAQHNVDAVNAEFKRRELESKYSLFIERKTTDALPKPQKQTAIKSFEEIMLLPDLDSQRAALIKYILENPSVKIPVAFSGGKDSIAMVLHLLELGVPKSQMELWHHDVDGHGEELFDWHVTPEYCQAFADAIGIKLLFSYRAGGIVKRLLRNNEPRGDVYYQTPDYQWHMTPSDHNALNTGGRWPSKGNDMNARWCSSEVKIDVASQILSNDPRLQGTRNKPMEILLCTGERHLESDKRATYAELQIYKKGSFTANRKVLSWRPIIEYSEEMVWELLKKWKIQPHPCYYLGWGRCSCQLCIFNEAPYWAASYEISPEKIIRIRQLEIITARYPKNEGKEHTLYDKMDIFEKSTMAKPVINLDTEEARFWIKQATEQFTLPIFVQGEWKLPSGAFKKENCGAS